MTSAAVVGAALGSTVFFSLATALKHRSAGHAPDAQDLRARQLARFVAATAAHPLWLAGILSDVAGLALQVYALHIGALAVVQPLLITALLISLVLNHWLTHTRMTAREVVWGAVLVAALVGFLLVSGAASPDVTGPPQPVERVPAAVAGIVALVIGGGSVLAARALPRGRGAALMGVTVGLIYAFTAALLKSCSNVMTEHGPVGLVTSWQLYLLLLLGASGLVLSQLTFQAGPLTASLPAIATIDPLVSVALGAGLYDERLRSTPAAVLGEIACLALLSAAAVFLSRVRAARESALPPPQEPALTSS